MNNLNVHMNHPLIAHPDKTGNNVQYVSISSQDRNLKKNPNSNDFVITLPQEYRNVESVKLASSYFPIVDDQFSEEQNNVDLCFRFKKAFNPLDVSGCTFDDARIFAYVSESILNNSYFRIKISNGRYSASELATEIQNRMNEEITDRMARRIYGTSRIKWWGDYKFEIGYFPGATVQSDLSPYITSDYNNVYFNSAIFASIEDAIDAFNAAHGTSIVHIQEGTQMAVVLPFTGDELNTFANTSTALDPPMLLTWKQDINNVLDKYLEGDAFQNGLFIQGSQEGYLESSLARKHFRTTAGYDHFKLIIDSVSTKFHIGNLADEFEIITDKDNYYSLEVANIVNSLPSPEDSNTYQANQDTSLFMPRKKGECAAIDYYADDLKWGLPVYLGLTGQEVPVEYKWDTGEFRSVPGYNLPTYYYYNKSSSNYQPFKRKAGGYSEASIFIVVPIFQLDVKGEPYFFMDLDTLNCLDEIAPYKDNVFSNVNNISTGNPNSAFAKLPLSILDDVAYGGSQPMEKTYTPALSRLSKVTIRLRFHNGRPVKFGVQPFSFVLQIKTSKLTIQK